MVPLLSYLLPPRYRINKDQIGPPEVLFYLKRFFSILDKFSRKTPTILFLTSCNDYLHYKTNSFSQKI